MTTTEAVQVSTSEPEATYMEPLINFLLAPPLSTVSTSPPIRGHNMVSVAD